MNRRPPLTFALLSFFLLMLSSFISAIANSTPLDSLGPTLDAQSHYKQHASGAEILHNITHAELDHHNHWLRRHYRSLRILDNTAARDYGRISIPFNHYYSTAELEFARVRNHNGEIKSVAEDAVQVRVLGGGQDFYEDRSEIVFSLPDVAPGSIIEFQYTTRTQKKAIESVSSIQLWTHWFQERVAGDGWRADGVHQFDFKLTLPNTVKPYFKAYGTSQPTNKTSKHLDTTHYHWHWRQLPAITIEANMPELQEFATGIEMSTSKSWDLVDQWAWTKVQQKLVISPTIKATLKKLDLPQNPSRDDKIKAVYRYLQHNVRYVFAHLGRGGYDPHSPRQTLDNGYGDCKDQTVLAVALLRALGIDAYPVLVETPSAGKSATELVSLIFDHMMVWIAPQEGQRPLWLDTTSDLALYPGVSNHLLGQTALVINGAGGKLTTIDADLDKNQARLKLRFHQTAENKTQVTAEYQPAGIYEQSLRGWWKHDTNRSTRMRQFLSNLFEDKGDYTLNYTVHNTEDLFQKASITAQFDFNQAKDIQPVTYGASFLQLYRMVGGLSSMQIPESRKAVYTEPMATDLLMKIHFIGGEYQIPTVVESGRSFKSDYFVLQQQGKLQDGNYLSSIEFSKPKLKLTPKQYAEYYRDLMNLSHAGNWVVSMQTPPKHQAEQKLEAVAAQHSDDSIEYQLALTKHLLDRGEFSNALKPATRAVQMQPANGEAWYLLGTVQGFNTLIKDSQESFERAAKLGYLP